MIMQVLADLGLAVIMAIGFCAVQDGICSILYYPHEGKNNHVARIARIIGGLALISISSLLILGG